MHCWALTARRRNLTVGIHRCRGAPEKERSTMLDLLIRNGSVVDGTGAPPRAADVSVRDGRIVGIGENDEPAPRTIDADGLTVIPGSIALHAPPRAAAVSARALSP